MNPRNKHLALILSILLLVGTVLTVSAAENSPTEIEYKTGTLTISDKQYNQTEQLTPSGVAPFTLLPEKYSSVELGFTLPVRQQHDNTCWAFGTLSSFETLLLANGESVSHLSPEHANFWGSKRDDNKGWQRTTLDGGYSYIPLGYLTSWSGPLNESDFPEQVSTKDDYNALSKTPDYGITEIKYFYSDENRNTIKEYIYNYGSVVGSFNADIYNYLSGANYFYCGDSTLEPSELTGHCVSVVGWDDNFSKERFADSKSGMPQNDGAWLIKNSWSEFAGDKGYYWVSYDDVWIFNRIFGPSYALTGYEKLNEGIRMYQNEIDGATYEFTYFTYTNRVYSNITYMNVFDFAENDRNLDKVIFESTAVGADYTIYYIPYRRGSLTSDTNWWDKLYEGTITHSGYTCADFEDFEVPAGKGAIGVLISNERVNTEAEKTVVKNSIGCGEWLTSGNQYIYIPQSEFGMSYYMDMDRSRPEIKDVMQFYSDQYGDDLGGTFVIKAITNNHIPEPTQPSTTTTTVIPTTVPIPTTTIPETTVAGPTETTTSNTFTYKLGDADFDGKVNVKDATLVQKAVARLTVLTEEQKVAGNATCDEKLNVLDSTAIQKYASRIPTNFPIGEVFTATIV